MTLFLAAPHWELIKTLNAVAPDLVRGPISSMLQRLTKLDSGLRPKGIPVGRRDDTVFSSAQLQQRYLMPWVGQKRSIAHHQSNPDHSRNPPNPA